MPVVKLPTNSKPYPSLDSSELDNVSDELVNGYINESDHTIKMPGLLYFTDLGLTGSAIDGEYYWDEEELKIVVANGAIYKVNDSGTKTHLTGATLNIGRKVSFASVYHEAKKKNLLFMANGTKIAYTDGDATSALMTSDQVPQYVDSLATINGFLLANDTVTKQFGWSKAGAPLTWAADSRLRPSAQGDDLVAIKLNNRRIYAYGKRTIEVYYNSGNTVPFTRVDGAGVEAGVISQDTITRVGNVLYWLDEKRRPMRMVGNQAQNIGMPYGTQIQAIDNIDYSYGTHITIANRDFWYLSFPSANVTYVFDILGEYWLKRTTWDSDTGDHDMFLMGTYMFDRKNNWHLIGNRNNTEIYKMSVLYTDDDGIPIIIDRKTGNVDHGNLFRKKNKSLTFKVKRGFGRVYFDALKSEKGKVVHGENKEVIYAEKTVAQQEQNAVIRWSYRDNGSNSYSNWIEIPLRNYGKSDFIWSINGMGTYNTRQYRIQYSGGTEFIFVEVWEDYEQSGVA